jgi:hypothetical protein
MKENQWYFARVSGILAVCEKEVVGQAPPYILFNND